MITVVTGAPCSGKTTFVTENAKSGDLIIDMDRLALALTTADIQSHDYSPEVRIVARSAREGAVKSALRIASVARANVWIVHTRPNPIDLKRYRLASARLVVIDPGIEVCLERLKDRPKATKEMVYQAIKEWFRSNE
jgi:dephospho-CoA kinase